MKQVSIILGYRNACYHCGQPIRLIMIPAVDTARWQICEDFPDGVPDVLELHDCPKHPSKVNGTRRADLRVEPNRELRAQA